MAYTHALTPISDESPAGVDIRNHSEFSDGFHQLRDLRNSIRSRERKAMANDDIYALRSEWGAVQEQCVVILENQSKDTEVLAWLAEASIRVDGFVGLADVFTLINSCLRQYWGQVYPLPDEEGISSTLYPLTGLNGENGEGTLVMPIRMATVMTDSSDETISGWDYLKSCELTQIVDEQKRQRKIDEGSKTLEQWQQLLYGVDPQQVSIMAKAIDQCIAQFALMDEFLIEQCGHDSPPTSAIKNVLTMAWDALCALAKVDASILDEDVAPVEEVPEPLIESESVDSGKTTPQAVLQFSPEAYYPSSREEALMMVSKLSVFFRDTEPHSPLSYQMERVERWGRMELAELMDELLDDDVIRNQFFRLIGLSKDTQ
ncbi:type VI secretion system protein TssA [Neptunomonas sp.]|uniref:type VI secretion system protein TssA n=1 Tax=Neptunomonas sp. TaxID=1971898 RepID=UPI0025F9E1BF|nr:type VI secretion system protein TssA [Neptunomonas sp.]